MDQAGKFIPSSPEAAFHYNQSDNSRNNSSSGVALENATQLVHATEEFVAPPSVKIFVIYMANEFHEEWPEEAHKLITNKNGYTVPTSLTVSNGTAIAFHNADAPWDSPHDYIVQVINNKTDEVAWESPLIGYQNMDGGPSTSDPVALPVGEYRIEAYLRGEDKVETKPLAINVTSTTSVEPLANLTMGFFYSPQQPAADPYDNDGTFHKGNLEYYQEQFPASGLKIESMHSFHFDSCSFHGKGKSPVCTDEGGTTGELYWHDNKTADHVLILWSSTKPYNVTSAALDKLTWENVYR
jgi:hypothetical protein